MLGGSRCCDEGRRIPTETCTLSRDDAIREIFEAIQRANELAGTDEQLACSEETILYGPGGALDSMGLVSLILDVETAVNDQAGTSIVLADERAVSQRRSPFRDVRSLADHVMTRLAEADACPSNPAAPSS